MIRILCDNGSERSWCTRSLANCLKLKSIRKERLSVFSFGSVELVERTYNFGVISLISRYDPDQLISVEVLIADTITTDPVAIPNADVWKDGRYEAKLLWRTDPRELKNNFSLAKRRFDELKKGFNKNEWIASVYSETIRDQETNGIIEECGWDRNEYFMPHRAVVRPDKEATKVRVVFNCGSKTCHLTIV
ncbi:hypothetical protein HNY73_005172 [Argiope bruennichi]|uniref:Peptidase aspartic putative domain-containing protein n=1 Tax=Argiope bruennichi TaxID=94029 RepID=A0A8T0FFL5_ARGBR|nr:hypothetical protein HNY73_005172 [Argiope bruennichi]